MCPLFLPPCALSVFSVSSVLGQNIQLVIPLYRSIRPLHVADEAAHNIGVDADISFCVDPQKHAWTDVLVRGQSDDSEELVYWYARLYLVCEVAKISPKRSFVEDPPPEVLAYVQWYEKQTKKNLCQPEKDGIPLDVCPRLYLTPVCNLISLASIIARVSLLPDLKGEEGRDFISVGPYKGLFPRFVKK